MKVSVRAMTDADRCAILAINAQHGPHVATLDAAELSRLLELGGRILVAASDSHGPVGYLVAFARSSAYDGEEFLWFRQSIDDDFLYVDQVAVAAPARRAGVGRELYGAADAAARDLCIACTCCEVNERPPNGGSMAFHAALGFEKLASLETADGRRVALLVRR